MYALSRALNILCQPPGDWAYFILLLLALEAGAAVAWNEWQRSQHPEYRRWWIVLSALVLLRLSPLAWLILRGWLTPTAFMPPLERLIDALSLVMIGYLIAWPTTHPQARLWLGVNAATLVAVFALFTWRWIVALELDPNLNYNGFWQDWGWGLWQMGLLIIVGIMAWQKEWQEKSRTLTILGVLLIGLLLHLLGSEVYTVPHVPGWVRLSQLSAYLLLDWHVYRMVMEELHRRHHQLISTTTHSIDQQQRLFQFIEIWPQLDWANLPAVLNQVVETIAQILNTDECALALPVKSSAGQMHLAAIYNPQRKGDESIAFSLNEQQAIRRAIRRREQVYLSKQLEGNIQLRVLYALMGSDQVGPLLIQPLTWKKETLGALILGNSRTQRPFSSEETGLVAALADQVAVILLQERAYHRLQEESEQFRQALQRQREESQRQRTELEIESQRHKQEAELFAQRLSEQEREVLRKNEQIERLTERLRQMEIEARSAQEEAEWLSQELHLQSERAESDIAALENEMARHKELIAQLRVELQRRDTHLAEIRAVVESMADGVLVTDEKHRIILINTTAENILGVEPGSLLGRSLEELSNTPRWTRGLEFLQDAVRRGHKPETIRLTMDLSQRAVEIHLTPVMNGQIVRRLVTVMRDLTAEDQAQRERDALILSLIQQLRTPITGVMSYTDLLLDGIEGQFGKSQREFLQRIRGQVERMTSLIDNLISMSAIDRGQLRLNLKPIDLVTITADAVIGTRSQLDEKEIDLVIDLPNLPLIQADPTYLQQILANLLTNACQVSPKGSQVELRARIQEDQYIIISVRDHGPGVPPEFQGHVFEQRPLHAEPIPGLGESRVGLAVVKALVEAHGGRVWVDSQPGQGTTFTLVLPLTTGASVAVKESEKPVPTMSMVTSR